MTYTELVKMKYVGGVSTYELVSRFPSDVGRVSEIALLEVPDQTLKEIILEEDFLLRVISLKRKFSRFLKSKK